MMVALTRLAFAAAVALALAAPLAALIEKSARNLAVTLEQMEDAR